MYKVHPHKLFYCHEMNGNLELARFVITTFYPKGYDLDVEGENDSVRVMKF